MGVLHRYADIALKDEREQTSEDLGWRMCGRWLSYEMLLGTRGAVLHHSAETVLCFRIHVLVLFPCFLLLLKVSATFWNFHSEMIPYLALLLLAYHCWLVRAYLALLWIAFHCLLDQQLGQQCFEGFELINLKDGFTTLPLGGGGWTKLISLAGTFAPTGVKHWLPASYKLNTGLGVCLYGWWGCGEADGGHSKINETECLFQKVLSHCELPDFVTHFCRL